MNTSGREPEVQIIEARRVLPRVPFAYELILPQGGSRVFTDQVTAWAWAAIHVPNVPGVVGRPVGAAI